MDTLDLLVLLGLGLGLGLSKVGRGRGGGWLGDRWLVWLRCHGHLVLLPRPRSRFRSSSADPENLIRRSGDVV
ncbi:hypothetical protein KCU88_g2, partial [Aureobasidium melanogenum]